MDLRVQFPDPDTLPDWKAWARQLTAVLTRMITPTPSDQFPIVGLADVRTAGVSGGASIAGFQVRTLNTEYDPVGICLLKPDSTFSLPKGRYFVQASAPALNSGVHQAFLRNVTTNGVAIWGTSEYNTGNIQTRSWIVGVIEPKDATVYRIEHYTVNPVVTNGLGVASGIGQEVYTQVALWGLQ